jgi:uncharacterized protein (DUF433 family)
VLQLFQQERSKQKLHTVIGNTRAPTLKEFNTSVKTAYQHIILDDTGVAQIEETTLKVVELVLDHKAYGWSPEELHLQHPMLSLGQIYSALAYYWDHQTEFDQDIKWRLQRVDDLRKRHKPASIESRLKAKGLI